MSFAILMETDKIIHVKYQIQLVFDGKVFYTVMEESDFNYY